MAAKREFFEKLRIQCIAPKNLFIYSQKNRADSVYYAEFSKSCKNHLTVEWLFNYNAVKVE